MNLFKRFFVLMIVLVVALGLCACGGDPDATEAAKDTSAPTANTTAAVQDTTEPVPQNPTYTVKVVDQVGNPVANCAVQLCLETCMPGFTNAEGIATFTTVEANYKVSVTVAPAGFTFNAEEYFYFENGSYEMTITLKAA